ncbi:hypothetical protein NX801_27655 [Streptomyces sp. LP05-1]|uniref:Flp pilus assembly protein RcpC/CpaB domain-containing protein n=1 Tax=Streptomyces pyxinae TaxID=2970734 RepID=A0ABT2CRM1_9ACTN|nr:hypothetical protein [Streptomyces sp. LP05-1]MCS0639346.1 hypothetical protein [Streptomyces sp. LP05-1]
MQPLPLSRPLSPAPPDPAAGGAAPLTTVPGPYEVPPFAPLRARGRRAGLRRALRRGRRVLVALVAAVAAALAAAGLRGPDDGAGRAVTAAPKPVRKAVALVSAPVRIADAETVRLLRPGDRVDVIATGPAGSPGPAAVPFPGGAAVRGPAAGARVVAAGVRVAEVPKAPGGPGPGGEGGGGALVVLSVPRPQAVALAGASATSRLAVAVC